MSTPQLRVAVVSDLHAYDKSALGGGATIPSNLEVGAPASPSSQHPITALIDLVTRESLGADLLLCGGDLGDKAHPAATQYAWAAVQQIATALGASHVLATAGNHDIDSRHNHNDYDAKGMLQSLAPRFPVVAEPEFDRYWSRHFVVWDFTDVRVLLLNSSAYHGARKEGVPPEYEHGRVADSTVAAIATELKGLPPKLVNLALCHHHPHSSGGSDASDSMKGGSALLRALGNSGEWLVVHGHTHAPQLAYAQGNTMDPIVFAAGSLCSRSLTSGSRNQFYVIEFPLSLIPQHGLVGHFTAWDWSFGNGWIPARRDSGLPHRGGFGVRVKAPQIAAQIAAKYGGTRTSIRWTELVNDFPDVEFLTPGDHEKLVSCLKDTHQYRPLYDVHQCIEQIDKGL